MRLMSMKLSHFRVAPCDFCAHIYMSPRVPAIVHAASLSLERMPHYEFAIDSGGGADLTAIVPMLEREVRACIDGVLREHLIAPKAFRFDSFEHEEEAEEKKAREELVEAQHQNTQSASSEDLPETRPRVTSELAAAEVICLLNEAWEKQSSPFFTAEDFALPSLDKLQPHFSTASASAEALASGLLYMANHMRRSVARMY